MNQTLENLKEQISPYSSGGHVSRHSTAAWTQVARHLSDTTRPLLKYSPVAELMLTMMT